MSSHLKPIKLWGQGGPNPPKVRTLLSELGLPFEEVPIPFTDIKTPEYLTVNPNGRLPSIHDPNTDLTLWESGAIIEYLIENYDKTHRLSFAPGTPEYYHAKQWLYMQTTGQGPYFGQAGWFKRFHHEQLPSAIERYAKEVNRVTGVLEGQLTKEKEKHAGSDGDGPWLVGNKLSYADLAFFPWQTMISMILSKEEYNVDDFPHVKAWLGKMGERVAVKESSLVPGK